VSDLTVCAVYLVITLAAHIQHSIYSESEQVFPP